MSLRLVHFELSGCVVLKGCSYETLPYILRVFISRTILNHLVCQKRQIYLFVGNKGCRLINVVTY